MKLNSIIIASYFVLYSAVHSEEILRSLETDKILPNKITSISANRSSRHLKEETSRKNVPATISRRLDESKYYDIAPTKYPKNKIDGIWFTYPQAKHNESFRKIDQWPIWSSKKETYNNRNQKDKKYVDPFEDFLAMDSKLHELSDRKYIHEHEGFFIPVPVPSHHHEKEDHLIPLLLLILLPLLLFAIIIPLNANLLSTLFLIMQNNGAATTATQLAPGRRKRHLDTPSPLIEQKVFEVLKIIDRIIDDSENKFFQ